MFSSLRAEDSVARVAKTGDDIAVVVEVIVQRGDKDVDIGVILLHALDAFGSADNAHELNVLHAVFLEEAEPPVASMGSTTMTSRSSISGGILK